MVENVLRKYVWLGLLITICFYGTVNAADPIRIMPLGDSITLGTGSSDGDTGYRNKLWYKLIGGGNDVDFVGSRSDGDGVIPSFDTDNEGWGGNNVADIRDGVSGHPTHPDHPGIYGLLEGQLLNATPADVVLLHIGTNEVGVAGASTEIEVAGLLDEIDRYEADYNPVKVILARIVNSDPSEQKYTDFNDAVEAMAQARSGDDITIVDMEDGAGIIYGTQEDMVDIHPTDTGYEKMANLWYSAIIGSSDYWNLDEGTNPVLYNNSIGIADGTCIAGGCPTVEANGIVNGAQSFNGTDTGIDLTETTNFDWAADASFTIEYWMNFSPILPSAESIEVIIGRQDTATSLQWWAGVDINGNARFAMFDQSGAGPRLLNNSDMDLADSAWHHIVIVRDGSTNENILYVDGVEKDRVSFTYTAGFAANDPLNIGHLNNNTYYSGSLDEIHIYNTALSSAAIIQNFNNVQTFKITTTEPGTYADVGIPYSYDFNTSEEPATFSYMVTPDLLDWLNKDTDGLVSGSPTADTVGNFDIDITATADISGQTDTLSYVLKVRDTSILPIGMEHYWKLDEESGPLYLDSYSGADADCGTYVCPTEEPNGIVNGAQSFNGTDSGLDVTETTNFDWAANESFTIEYWMNMDSDALPTGGEWLQVIIGRVSTDTSVQWWSGVDLNGHIRFHLLDQNGNGPSIFDNGEDLTDTGWHHIGIVRNGSTNETILYVDGIEKQRQSFTYTASFAANDPLNMGYLDDGYYYGGSLDEVAVFDSALSLDDIQQHHQNGLAGKGFEADNIPPVITLEGVNPQKIEVKTAYVELGATADDNVDGDITDNIVINATAVDTNTVGTYTVTYNVSDAAGNTATEVSRTVIVEDTIAPVITLTGDAIINLLLNDSYSEPGVSCADNYDAICTVITGGDTVDTSTVGNYIVTYNAMDAAGNTAIQVSRTVNVSAGNAPVITLDGANPYTVEVHSTYVDPGATATDIEDGTVAVTNDSATSVDTAIVGTYTVTYAAIDSQGNTSQATRTVQVVDTIAPVITLTGDATINLLLNDTYTEQNATCTDNYDATCTVIIGGDTVDTSTVGNYIVTYNATDAAGNTAIQVSRTVNVTAGNAPVITLDGANPYTVEVHSTYVDPGATATDIEDGTVTVTNDSATSVDTAIVGTYTVTYTAIDSQGNTSQATRTVTVVDIPVDDWYTVSPDGNTYTVGDTSVELDANLFTITVSTDSIVFEENGSDPKVYIKLMSNGEVFTGYIEGTVENPTVTSGFAPGTQVSVGTDMVILIEAPLTTDLTLGDK